MTGKDKEPSPVFTQVAFEAHDFLPDEPSFSAEATLSVEDDSIAEVAFEQPEEGRILIEAHKYGETGITVTDGEKYIGIRSPYTTIRVWTGQKQNPPDSRKAEPSYFPKQ